MGRLKIARADSTLLGILGRTLIPISVVVRTTELRSVLLLALVVGTSSPLQAQRGDTDPKCREAVSYLRETTRAEDFTGDAAATLAEKRQNARAQLLSCGGIASEYAASVISETRLLVDTVKLRTEMSDVVAYRDASVFAAALEVASDRNASEPARAFALRTLSLLSRGTCGRCWPHASVPDERHKWRGGTPLPPDADRQSRELANRIAHDESEPEGLRALAACLAGT